MRELTLMLPNEFGEPETFDMMKQRLVFRTNPGGVSSIYIIDESRIAYRCQSYERHWSNALVLVGKFLADNPTF